MGSSRDLARILGTMNVGFNSKIDNLGKSIDVRVTRLESYIKEGFNSIDSKVAPVALKYEGLAD